MIEFRYKREKLSDSQAQALGSQLERMLREAIDTIRPDKLGYGVTVEGDAFGPITHNLPGLRIYVFYHQEWDFSDYELESLLSDMVGDIGLTMQKLEIARIPFHLRFYSRTGHAGVSIST